MHKLPAKSLTDTLTLPPGLSHDMLHESSLQPWLIVWL